jgi:eukaryotic translation initiation factor 2C
MSSSRGMPAPQNLYPNPNLRHFNMDFNSPTIQEAVPSSLPQRPKNFNTYGKETTIMLNTFNVIKPPTILVHQYDVSFTGDGKDYSKRALLQKIWKSKAVKSDIGDKYCVWDGNKLAW